MPKKQGINTKALEAKLRKESNKKAKEELLQKQKEDEYWKDDDKLINRKLVRQQQRDQKREELLQRKAQNRLAYEEELKNTVQSSSSSNFKNKEQQKKVTRSQIQNLLNKQQKDKTKSDSETNPTSSSSNKKEPTHLELPLEENINRLKIDGDEARTIDDAIVILSSGEPDLDRHPERRVKAAWLAYEEKHLQRLKQENPALRLSQLKEMLRKDFNKSAENPLNQLN